MRCPWFRKSFLRVLEFLEVKVGGNKFPEATNFAEFWIICSPLLYFNLKSFMDRNCPSLIRFQSSQQESGVFFSESWNFYRLKRGGPNIWGEPILQNVWVIWSPLLYFNFQTFLDPNSLSFISQAFCMIQEYFSVSLEISRKQSRGT